MGYAQALVPGWKIILQARNTRYLYTASAKHFRYGGPVDLWGASMLFIEPLENEPNMNGDLYQCSLLGTNSVKLATGAAEAYPQAKGAVLFTRRTSRSGFALLLVNASAPEKPVGLGAAFSFGAAALNEKQDTWAAYARTQVGGGWAVQVARIGAKADPLIVPLPAGVQPGQIAWVNGKVMIKMMKGEMPIAYNLDPAAAAPAWAPAAAHTFPGMDEYLLNKSESLSIDQVKKDGKPAVEVAGVWFTGDRNVLATIPGLTLRGEDLLGRFAVVWGELNGAPALFTVNIATGEVISGLHGTGRNYVPWEWPPLSTPEKAGKK